MTHERRPRPGTAAARSFPSVAADDSASARRARLDRGFVLAATAVLSLACLVATISGSESVSSCSSEPRVDDPPFETGWAAGGVAPGLFGG